MLKKYKKKHRDLEIKKRHVVGEAEKQNGFAAVIRRVYFVPTLDQREIAAAHNFKEEIVTQKCFPGLCEIIHRIGL